MQARSAIAGFYGVLDRDDEALARALLGGGARVVQLRLKGAAAEDVVRIGTWLKALCLEHAAALVINDRVDLALALGAHGVHLGQTDLPLAAARALVGDRMWIGISTHDLDQVSAAVRGGADYLGYGPVFATTTKANPDPVQGLDALAAAVRTADEVPIVAIGGITPNRAGSVYATGCAAVCAIGAVNNSTDPAAAARACGPGGRHDRAE